MGFQPAAGLPPRASAFERETAACAGTRYAVATATGTAALHISLLVAGVQPGDEVLVSPG